MVYDFSGSQNLLAVAIWVTFFEVLIHLFVASKNLEKQLWVIMNRWVLVEFHPLYKIARDISESFSTERCKKWLFCSKINFHAKLHLASLLGNLSQPSKESYSELNMILSQIFMSFIFLIRMSSGKRFLVYTSKKRFNIDLFQQIIRYINTNRRNWFGKMIEIHSPELIDYDHHS